MICLGDDSDNEPDSLLRLLDILLSSDRNINEKKQLLENDFQISMTEHLERGVSEMCNLSKGIEEKGIQKGIEQGIEQGTLSSIKSLMESMGWSLEQAMDALKLSTEEREKYLSSLTDK